MNEEIRFEMISKDVSHSIIEQIAKIHRSEIENGFLSTLGENVLTKIYKGIIKSPHSLMFAAFKGDTVVGFICGSTDTSKVYRSIVLKSILSLVPVIIPKMFSKKNIFRLAETLMYPSKKENCDLPKNEILNFCVDRAYQAQGLGRRLFDLLMIEYKKYGLSQVKIVTGKSQTKAQLFYHSIGAKRVKEIELHKDIESVMYIFKL